MHSSLRRTVALASAALATCAVVVPLTASPALAAGTPTETQFYAADTDGDFSYGLYRRSTPTGTPVAVVAESPYIDVDHVSASADGSRFAAIETTYDSLGNPGRKRLAVFDVSGRLVRIVQDVAATSTHLLSPVLSPDGSVVVWNSINETTHVWSLMRANVASGAATLIANNDANPVFADASTLVIEDVAGPWYSILAAGGGTRTALSAIDVNAWNPSVSADGTKIAWGLDTTTGAASTGDVQVASLSVTSPGVASVGTPTTVATGLDNNLPSFSRDGSTVYFIKDDGNGGNGSVYTTPSDGTSTTGTAVATTGDVISQAIGTTDDGTAPGSATALADTPNGTLATIRWTNPSDSDLSGVLITRDLGTTWQKTVYVPAGVTSYVDSGLVVGSTYTYSIVAVDRSGNQAAASVHKLTALKPGATFSDPTSTTATHAPFLVRFGASSAYYTVDYLIGGTTTWRRWQTSIAGVSRVFGSAATTGVNATTSVPGASYAFRVTAKDAYGNTTATIVSGRAVVPFDQTKAAFSGGVTVASSAAWLGSVRVLKATTNYAKVTLYGNQFRLIGWKCRSCGAFSVWDGSTLVATVDSYAASGAARVVVYTRTYSALGWHTFTIRPKATAGRPYVYLDGFAMRR